MQNLDDIALLREYVECGSGEAFATIVARHVNKVYSVALRHTRDPLQAEEVTQAVFVILARKSRQFGKGVILSGWLYQAARLTAITFIRGEIRRNRREMEAYVQTSMNQNDSEIWKQISPLLDAAMASLTEAERHAVVLRFFDGKSFGEAGAALGANEDAVRKRVDRALEKLRRYFARQGVNSTTTILAGTISVNSVQVAPIALAKTAAAVALADGSAAGFSTLTLVKGASRIMAWTKAKTAMVTALGILLVTGATTTVVYRHTIAHKIVLACGRYAIARHTVTPVDLTGVIAKGGMSASVFDRQNQFLAWRTVPYGFQVFDHVPLQIDGAIFLWGEANAKRYNIVFPEQILGIPMDQKFDTRYIYHCTFFDSTKNTPVYEVVFRYADGLSMTNQMLYGNDVLDWNANRRGPIVRPSGPNSKLAWVGGSSSPKKNMPLCLCLTAITNPLPSIKIASIDLYSCKSVSAACIMAMTTGRSGLLK